ncbi:MAG: tetratricopeptide repeat protein, partial [Chloroflexi bacterium]|nr:tetratricopeptide repeat protein [Chloroflexota bacterium]
PRMVGVALPVGLLFGVLTYLVSQALYFKRRATMPPMNEDQILLMALVGAIVAHFAEIHFGIAIAATRTYFWMYVGVLVLIGYRLRQTVAAEAAVPVQAARPLSVSERLAAIVPSFAQSLAPAAAGAHSGGVHFARRRRRDKVAAARGSVAVAQARTAPSMSTWANSVVVYGLLLGIIMQIMVFNFLSPNLAANANVSWIYALFAFTLIVGALVLVAQVQAQHSTQGNSAEWLTRFLLIAAIALSTLAMYVLVHLPRLSPRQGLDALATIGIVADTISIFYLFFFALLLLLAVFLMQEGRSPATAMREPFFMLIYAGLMLVAVLGVKITNLDSIRADIYYKQGLNFDSNRQWDGSITMYREAINLAPDQDFYYLFYGRAYLEKAKTVADSRQRSDLLETARKNLIRARDLNPLNTDHTANLARLYRTWSELSADANTRNQYLNESLEYYEQSQTLSPHNAQIYNEFGSVYALMGQTDQALAKYKESLAIDSEFGQTYLVLGDLYQSKQDWDNAITTYQKATKYDAVAGYNALGNAYIGRQDYDNAAKAYQAALAKDPNFIQAHSALGLIYSRQNKFDQAISENLIVL